MEKTDFSYFIERYNAGEMSESEREWFLKEMDGNVKLQKEVNLRKQTDDVLKKQNIISLRNKLSEIEKNRKPAVKVKRLAEYVHIKYAAVIAVLILVGSITILSNRSLSNEEIIQRYYKVYDPPTSQRSVSSGADIDYTKAMEFYNLHDYKMAAILFNRVVLSNPKDMQSTLLNGMSNFEDKKYPEAKRSFGKVIDNNNNLYIDQAEWYLAFCYIRTNEKEKAIQQFEIIGNENGIYKNLAKKILRKMK